MLSLKNWTASAMAPTSSLRPRAGISTVVLPWASDFIASVICAVGRAMPRVSTKVKRRSDSERLSSPG